MRRGRCAKRNAPVAAPRGCSLLALCNGCYQGEWRVFIFALADTPEESKADMPKKIIIDTDPGIDDAMALLFALAAPELEVIGLTTVYGNVTVARATHNALHLLEFAGHPAVPVAEGAAAPLVYPFGGPADFVHGMGGLGNVAPAAAAAMASSHAAAQWIVETVMAHPGEITLVPIGPLTNIALALMLEPRIVDAVAGVVLMGGAATVNGNVNPAAEANIYNDPHAADRVLTAGWPVTMVGLDVTEQVVMDEAYLRSLCVPAKKTGTYICDVCEFYLDYHERSHQMRATYTHDPAAIAYLLNPSLFTTTRGAIRVLTEGMGRGQTLLDRRGRWSRTNAWAGQQPVNVCVGVDEDGLLALYKEHILAAD